MLQLSKFLETPTGNIIISILLGFGLSTIFKMTCKDKNCVIYTSPDNLNDIKNDIYSFNGNCYQYSPKEVKCNSSKRTVYTK